MLRYHIYLACLAVSLSGCAWKYQSVVNEPSPGMHLTKSSAPPVLSNISLSKTMPSRLIAIDDMPPKAIVVENNLSQFPDSNATEAEWNSYWQKRFPQTDVFSKTPQLNDDWFFRWDRHYQSPQNRPIQTMQLGEAKSRVMVLGSLHGNEPVATYLAEQIARYIGNKPVVWKATSSLVVRNPNPDGSAKNTFTNGRGVDLNRNFPSEDFAASHNHRSGARAGSEVETQIVCRMMTDYAPTRVVHIKTSADSRGWVIYNKKAKGTALMMGDPETLRPKELASIQLSGSIESYVTHKRNLEMITIIVPRDMNKETAWRIYREPLLTALTHHQQETKQLQDNFNGTHGLNEQTNPKITPRAIRPPSQSSRLGDIFKRFNTRR